MRAVRMARAACVIVAFAMTCASTIFAQSRAAAPMPAQCTGNCIAIRSTGGFLGYLDGFPEFPGWPGDSFEGNPDLIPNLPPADPSRPVPYGGLIGVATYLKSHALPSVLLISGNNHPEQIAALRNPALRNDQHAIPAAAAHWFWKPMIDMRPHAVGVGTEDVHRWLAQMRPEHLRNWVRDGIAAGLPLVATNVIVRLTGERLNVVHDAAHDVTVDVDAGESLDLIDSLTLKHPCAVADALRRSTFSFDSGPAITVKGAEDQHRASAKRCRTTIELAQPLRPGRSYLLQSSLTGASFRFRLRTHDVLTPHAAWDGLPVAGVTSGGVPLAIMSFLSPSTAKALPPEYFAWNQEQGCAAAKCRIEILSPEDTARSMLDGLTTGTDRPAPVLLVISDLADDENTALLDAVPEIRFIALHPDSGRLGRAALPVSASKAGEPRYSGDISFGAVVDERHPQFTRFMVRPTWLGEIVHTAVGELTLPASGGSWHVNNPALWVQPVPGASLGSTTSSDGVRYTAVLDPARFRNSPPPVPAEPAVFRPYCPIDPSGPFDAISRERQGDLWTDRASFAGLVLDDMRRSFHADIALVPASWIDRDVMAAMKDPPATGVPPLSGFMLQRVLYRSKRVVRVAVEGSALHDTLTKIVDAAAAEDDALCISGLGLADRCPLPELDVDELLVNLRTPEEGHYYRVAMPAAMALAEGFTFDESATRDLLVSLDARLAACARSSIGLRTAEDPVAARLESRLAARPHHYVKLDPLTLDFASTTVDEPGDFARLPVDGFGGRPSRRIAVEGDVNAVLWDTPAFAVRIPAELRYNQMRVAQSTSYDEDEFSIGLRVDRKRFPMRWAGLFAGVFWDGRLFDRVDDVDSVRNLGAIPDPSAPGVMLPDVTVPGPTLAFTTAPQRNLAVAYGLEIEEQTFGRTTVSGLQFGHYYGRVHNVPVAVRLGDETIDLVEFLKVSPGDTLSARYQQNLSGITEETPFGYLTATRRQSRIQIDAKTRTKIPFVIAAPLAFSTEHRYRWYHHDEQDKGLFTEYRGDTKLSLDVIVGRRWSIGPYAERTDVTVGIKGAADQRFSAFSWGLQVKVPLFWNGRSID